jgi:hypothetical protein
MRAAFWNAVFRLRDYRASYDLVQSPDPCLAGIAFKVMMRCFGREMMMAKYGLGLPIDDFDSGLNTTSAKYRMIQYLNVRFNRYKKKINAAQKMDLSHSKSKR